MLGGFKKFILRGNVVDMAVGVVIGAAFAGVVAALTKDLLTPLIAALVESPRFLGTQFYSQRQRRSSSSAISSTPAFRSCWSRRRCTSSS